MNRKYTVRTEFGDVRTCVVDTDEDICRQLEQVFQVRHGQGLSVTLRADEIELVDIYHGSSVTSAAILKTEDTDEAVSLRWTIIG